MKTIRIALLTAAFAAAGVASAQSRVNAILEAVNDRIATQQDVWFDDGDFPAAIQLLKVQAALRPSDYEVWTNLGWMQENVLDWSDAEATYDLYLRQNPNDPDGRLPMAEYYSRRREYAKIPTLLEPTVGTNCHPNNYRILARAYEKVNRFDDSARVWKAYLVKHSDDGQALVNLRRVEAKAQKG